MQELKDVLYVPSFSVNLLSVSKADSGGTTGAWGHGTLVVFDEYGHKLISATLRDGLYHADCTVQRSKLHMAATAATKPNTDLVHRRWGHTAMSILHKMSLHG